MENKKLKLNEYDAAESSALESIPNRIIECTRAVSFSDAGYPTRVRSSSALVRYVDVMHEGRASSTFHELLRGITNDEFNLLKTVTRAIKDNSEKQYKKKMVATGSLLRALLIVRTLKALYPEKKRLVFEIGHGSGYVGALLLADGYAYASTDIVQAFYVYQNNLLEELIPGQVTDLVNGGELTSINSIKPGHAVHVPWWKFYSVTPNINMSVDAVTCNHALAEMHPNSLHYILHLAKMMLQKKDGSFVFEGWGDVTNAPIWSVAKKFSDLGYVIAHNNMTEAVYLPEDNKAAQGCIKFVEGELDANVSMEEQFHPPIHISSDSPLSKRITSNLESINDNLSVTYKDVCDMFASELGSKDLLSDDEKFFKLTDGPS
ncbi:MAG: hypothetical protein VX354_04455 [Pseudomonadota bacterium]